MSEQQQQFWLALTLLLLVLFVTGCASNPVETQDVVVNTPEVKKIQLPRPSPQKHVNVVWSVLSSEQKSEAIRLLIENNSLICVAPDQYENLSRNMAEISRWSEQMIELVNAYEERLNEEANPREQAADSTE